MSLFLETIKINNGRRINLDGHNQRLNHTRNRHFHEIRNIDLKAEINVPEQFKSGIVKCRVVYGRMIEGITFERYNFRNPRSFKVVNGDHIVYEYKSADREALDLLFGKRGIADDILMTRNGYLTDSFYANVALLKNAVWYTPEKPLLQGTFRASLISNEKLVQKNIKVTSLVNFEKVKIFNAMTEWEMHNSVDIVVGKSILF